MSILNFMAKARIVFVRACQSSLSCVGLACTSCLSGFQHQVQEQRGEDERYRTNHQHRVITSGQSSGYKLFSAAIAGGVPLVLATLRTGRFISGVIASLCLITRSQSLHLISP
jgi:hypothetical protein